MEMGEGASVAAVKVDPDKYLKAKLIEISFNDTYKSCRSLGVITAPHWPAGKPDGYNKSKKAAVLQLGKGKSHTAKVKLKMDSKGLSGTGKLTGKIGKLVFEGEVPLSNGPHEVTVTLKEAPEMLYWARGSMSWEVNADTHAALAGNTRVELFFVFDDPANRKFFKSKGVWIEALRFIFKNAKLDGARQTIEGLGKVTWGCFALKTNRYEIEDGASNFGGAAGFFELANYMKPTPRKSVANDYVNCYDQAYSVIVFSVR